MSSSTHQTSLNDMHRHYQLVARAIEYLRAHHLDQPSLKHLASALNSSEYHLQRVFSDWAGISPKQFLQVLTKEHAKRMLGHESVLNTALESGLSNSSRLHDLFVTHEAMSPGEYKHQGRGLKIDYGHCQSPFGRAFLALTERGLCKLSFFDHPDEYVSIVKELQQTWAKAELSENGSLIEAFASEVFGQGHNERKPVKLLLRGSPFRVKVWEALLAIPQGKLVSYQDIAQQIGQPNAVRAAASAIAQNDIGYLIPCHRVIRSSGDYHHYRWGPTRKAAMIARETRY